MKILFCDLLLQKGNKHVDECMLSILSEDNDVYYLSDEIRSDQPNITYKTFCSNKNPSKIIPYYFTLFRRMIECAKYAKLINPDVICFSTYENRVFPLGLPFFVKKNHIVVVENNNIDYLTNRLHYYAYRLFANTVHHIVFEQLFGDYLEKEQQVTKNNIHVVPHIQYRKEYEIKQKEDNTTDVYDCIAISGSNDDTIIKDLINYENKNRFLEKNGVKLLIKSHSIQYESTSLKVIGDFIPIKKYNQLFKNCKVVYAPFPYTYKYRMSGCYVDSFSSHKAVVASNIELAKYYNKRYGDIIKPCCNIEETIKAIIYYCNNKVDLDFSLFENEHSYNAVKEALIKALESIRKI